MIWLIWLTGQWRNCEERPLFHKCSFFYSPRIKSGLWNFCCPVSFKLSTQHRAKIQTGQHKQFSTLKEKNRNLQESLTDRMISDMAAVKAELSALRSRVEGQDQQIGELKKKLEEKASRAPSHSEVQRKRPASSPDWTPEQKKSRSEDLDQILQPFWPDQSYACERLSERKTAGLLQLHDGPAESKGWERVSWLFDTKTFPQ